MEQGEWALLGKQSCKEYFTGLVSLTFVLKCQYLRKDKVEDL